MVWETRVTDAAGRLLALVIQTQMVLLPRAPGSPSVPRTSATASP